MDVGALTPEEAPQNAWVLLWKARAGAVVLRSILLFLAGSSPLGAAAVLRLSHWPPHLAYPTVIAGLAIVAWLPRLLMRPLREGAYRMLPRLRPVETDRRSRWVLNAYWGMVGIILVTPVVLGSQGSAVVWTALTVELVVVVGLSRPARRPRSGSSPAVSAEPVVRVPRSVVRETGAAAERQHARAEQARNGLLLPSGPPVEIVMGRVAGKATNGFATRTAGRWVIILATQIAEDLDDAQLRALLAHEIGHTLQRPARRWLPPVLTISLSSLGGLALTYAIWNPLTTRLTQGWSSIPSNWPDLFALALQAWCTYLVLRLLWPGCLLALRAGEASADLAMLNLTGDPKACVALLETLAHRSGIPRRWNTMQRLLVATHPAIDTRIALIRAAAGPMEPAGADDAPAPLVNRGRRHSEG